LHKVVDQPLYFQGGQDALAFAGVLPAQMGGGVYYFRLAVTPYGDSSRLTLARVIPESAATSLPGFDGAQQSVLADDIAEVRFSYSGATRIRTSRTHLPGATAGRIRNPASHHPHRCQADEGHALASPVVEPRLAPRPAADWDVNRNRCTAT
jgi:hypothetical protein